MLHVALIEHVPHTRSDERNLTLHLTASAMNLKSVKCDLRCLQSLCCVQSFLGAGLGGMCTDETWFVYQAYLLDYDFCIYHF